MADWTAFGSCPQCEAKRGGACYDLLAAGPQALPSQYRDVPHSGRIKAAARATAVRSQPRGMRSQGGTVARRAARKTETTATGWAAVALKQPERKRAQ